MLFFSIAVAASPALALHETLAHGEDAHHTAPHCDVTGFDQPGHSHGDHAHTVLRVTSNRVQFRPDLGSGVTAVSSLEARTPQESAGRGMPRVAETRPAHSPHPLSITSVLRI